MNEFEKTLLERLSAEFPKKNIHIENGNRVNLQERVLLIKEDGKNFSPVIYLKEYYEQYLKDNDIESVLCSLRITIEDYTENIHEIFDFEQYRNFQKAKKHIYFRVVNKELNKEYLKSIVNIPILDLSLIFYFKEENYNVVISNEMLNYWNINIEELHISAIQNSAKSRYDFIKMDIPFEHACIETALYILTTPDMNFGACAMFYPDVLKNIAVELNSDFYIFPSSINEVIIKKDNGNFNTQDLQDIIKNVNQEFLDESEFLSNSLYYYSRTSDKVTILN